MKSSRAVAASSFLVCSALVVATFGHLVWGGDVPIYRDTLLFTIPHKLFLASRLRHGELPLWNPLINMGTPFLANPQSGVLYPMSALLLLPFPLSFGLYLVAHYLVAMSGMWILLRRRGVDLLPAAVGGLTFALGGYLVSMMNLTNHLQGAAWAPWVVLAAIRLFERPGRSRIAVFSIAVALQLLSGSPETLLMTLAIVAAWTVYASAGNFRAAARAEARVLLGCLLAVALTGVQVIPALEYLRHSPRGSALPLDQVTAWSLQPVSLLQLLVPHTGTLLEGAWTTSLGPQLERNLPWILSLYLGIGPLCLAIVGLAYGGERRFWGAVLAAGVFLSLGAHNPAFAWLYDTAPLLFGKFRFPEKFFFAAHFSAAVLAAEGTQHIVRRRADAERLAYVAFLTFIAVAAAVLALREISPWRYLEVLPVIAGKYLPPWKFVDLAIDMDLKLRRLLSMLAIGLSLLFLRRNVLGPSSFALLFIAFVAVDLGSIHANLNLSTNWERLREQRFLIDPRPLRQAHERTFHYQLTTFDERTNRPSPVEGLSPWSERISAMEDLSSFYRGLWRTLYPDIGLAAGVAALSGGDAVGRNSDLLLLQSLARLPRRRAVGLARAYGVRLLIGPEPLDVAGLERVTLSTPSPFFVYRIPDPCPRVAVATKLLVEAITSNAVRRIADPGFSCGTVAVVPELPAGWKDVVRHGSSERATTVLHEGDDWVSIQVHSRGGGFLVLNESDFSGWSATVDRAPVLIHQTNAFVRGVVVPPGEHTVRFSYRPASVRAGAWLSAAALVVLLLLLVPRPRSPSEHSAPR